MYSLNRIQRPFASLTRRTKGGTHSENASIHRAIEKGRRTEAATELTSRRLADSTRAPNTGSKEEEGFRQATVSASNRNEEKKVKGEKK